jgi:hypothetical protein
MKVLPLSSTTHKIIATKRDRGKKMSVVTGAGISHIQMFVAKQALEIYIRTDGGMELTRGGVRSALRIISEATGKTYKRSMAGKREALSDCEALLGE